VSVNINLLMAVRKAASRDFESWEEWKKSECRGILIGYIRLLKECLIDKDIYCEEKEDEENKKNIQ